MDWTFPERNKPSVGATATGGQLDERAVRAAYRRWAPIYDRTFGRIAEEARTRTVALVNQTRRGRVLEVGVGTGLSLPEYSRHLEVVGIDLSPEMLDRARERVADDDLRHVTGLHEMDASELSFPDCSFDCVAAMFVMTVVPDPEQVMRELARVTRPGGRVIIVNHFSREDGLRGWVERRLEPFGDRLGWRPVFGLHRVLGPSDLSLTFRRNLRPFGLFTLLEFRKTEAMALADAAE